MTETASFGNLNIADKVIDRFGGMAAMEKVTPFTYNEIRNFRRRGNIPEKDRPTVLRCALEAGVDVTPWTFIEHLVTIA